MSLVDIDAEASVPGPVPARQRRKEARPQELLDAALALFVEKGFAAARTDEVAARAGVSKGTLYLYYPSKEELFKAVVRHNLSSLIAEGIETLAAYPGTTGELLRYVVHTWWERVGATQAGGIHKVILAEARNFPDITAFYAAEVIEPAHRLFQGIVARGIERGEFRRLPPGEVAHAMIAPMIFLALHRHSIGACSLPDAPAPDPKALLDTHVELLLHGLTPSRACLASPGSQP
jgi:AcrR family transcriptional regulator